MILMKAATLMKAAILIPFVLGVSCDVSLCEEPVAKLAATAPQAADGATEARDAKPARAAKVLKRWDSDGNGKVTRGEVPAKRQAFFDRALRSDDKDGDSALNAAELTQVLSRGRQQSDVAEKRRRGARRNPAAGLFALLDSNHDRKLSRAELEAAAGLVAQYDKDGDETLSLREITRAARKAGEKVRKKTGKKKAGKKKDRRPEADV